jgi:hypothetical protein
MSDFLRALIDKRPSEVSGYNEASGAPSVVNSESRLERIGDAEIVLAEKSGLFDELYYLENYPDVRNSDLTPLEHFLGFGYLENRRPNFYFEPLWYISNNEDVRSNGNHPLLHYIQWGDKEGRRPGPYFNCEWYRARFNVGRGEIALRHYIIYARSGKISPTPEFDVSFYLGHSPDVASANVDPFIHFLLYGYKEGRNPSADFDVHFYAKRYLNGSLAANPFIHYLIHKNDPGIFGRVPDDEATIPKEIKKFSRPGPDFEEFRPLPHSTSARAMVLAYHLPQFHTFPENDKWWGKGFTEWTNVGRGLPRFKGHYQPRTPRDLGFYSLDHAESLARQVFMALQAGISGFIFYYYWFNGKRLMEKPVEQFLSNPAIEMPFCLMWANENWTRRWDGAESEVLISQDYDPLDDERMIREFSRHFMDSRYIRLNGRPLLMIYRARIIPEAKKTIRRWRNLFLKNHNQNPIIIMAQSFKDTDPREFGLDGAIEFPPHKLTQNLPPVNSELELLDDEFDGKVYRYEDVIRVSLAESQPDFPLIKTVVPSWDNDARRQGSGLTVSGSTPARYEGWLSELISRSQTHRFFERPIVCVNAWNEWCEGAYLEPDLHFGSAYLNATSRAIFGVGISTKTPKLLLVGHDAFPSGAQLLLLHIGESLRRDFGLEVEFLLLDGGKLEERYRSVAPTTVLGNVGQEGKLAAYFEQGFQNAIVNTTAAALALRRIRSAGIEAVVLVHELPRIIKEKGLTDGALAAMDEARKVVFAAPFVRDELLGALKLEATERCLILPQGIYQSVSVDREAGRALRHQLGIKDGDKVVLAAGYADLRKGFDLFIQLWWKLCALGFPSSTRIHLVWAGDIDPNLNDWLRAEINQATQAGTFHALGFRRDMNALFALADVFALTSREDPFPSVVLEAWQAGIRCFAFERSGGIPDLLNEVEPGSVVPYCDVSAMAGCIRAYLDAPRDVNLERARAATANERFSFRKYVRELLGIALPKLPTISVVVPNYNYAKFMHDRLGSIFGQDFPVSEVIVLDDCSTDDSIDAIKAASATWGREITLVANETNSGSVFAQWRKGAELAKGDYLWIAEADDLSDRIFLSSLLDLMSGDPSIALAFSDSKTINSDGSPQWESYKAYFGGIRPGLLSKSEVFEGPDFVRDALATKNVILNVSSVVWKRTALLRALDASASDLREFKMAGDWRLYLECLSVPGARVAYDATPLNVHRRHANSVTHSLDGRRHVDEIATCHRFAAESFQLGGELVRKQRSYREEVAAQLGISDVVPGDVNSPPRSLIKTGSKSPGKPSQAAKPIIRKRK